MPPVALDIQCNPLYRPLIEGIVSALPLRNTPQIKWEEGGISFICLSYKQAGRFMHEMLNKWLVPGRRCHLSYFFVGECSANGVQYTVGRAQIEGVDFEEIRERLSLIESELFIGLSSPLQAQRILELKGFSTAEKSGLIQERLGDLIERRPLHFEGDLFELMQQLLLIGGEAFCRLRDTPLIARMIAQFYILKKNVEKQTEKLPQKRHLIAKVGRACLHSPFGKSPVLNVLIAMNFVREHETLTRKQLIRSIRAILPNAVPIEESFLVWTPPNEPIQLLYIEMEKEDKTPFTSEEMRSLKEGFSRDIQGRIEHLLRPLFMPRNAEEIMRGAVTLSSQLRYPRDIPQVLVHFDEQRDQCLCFTVIVARVAHPLPFQEVLEAQTLSPYLSLEKIKKTGMVRRRFPKEVAIFRCRLPEHRFLRYDDSVDLYAARSQVISEIQDLVGEVRDFNGGMLAKHTEIFVQLKKELAPPDQAYTLLLEKFFYSIYPAEFRSVVSIDLLKTAFHALVAMIQNSEPLSICEEGEGMVVIKEEVELEVRAPLSSDLLTFQIEMLDRHLVGYLCCYPEPSLRAAFRDRFC